MPKRKYALPGSRLFRTWYIQQLRQERNSVEPEPEPVYCPDMTFFEALVNNSSGAFDGMKLTVTNDGGGFGNYYVGSNESWISDNGKVSAELTFDSSTDLSGSGVFLSFLQAGANVVALEYRQGTGHLIDVVASSTLATITPTIGQFTLGITLDQSIGRASYSYKLNNASAPSANAPISVAGAYDNAVATSFVTGSNTPTSGVNVIISNTGQAEFVTNVDGEGYCEYT